MKYQKSLSFFIPVYNEGENLKIFSNEIIKFLEDNFIKYEFIIVANVSKDDTSKIAQEIASKNKNVRVIQQKEFVGYGKQIGTGWENSKNEIVFYTDGDGQFDVNEIKKLMPYIDEYDVVTGYRQERKDPLMRIIYSKMYNLALRFVLGLNFKDIDCGFKLCKKEVINKIKPFTQDRGPDAEFLVKAKAKGFKIKQVPVTHRPRVTGVSEAESKSTGFFIRIKPEIIKSLINETINLHKIKNEITRK